MTGKRKQYSTEFKAKVALEALRSELTVSHLAAKHGVHQTLIGVWKRQALDGLVTVFISSASKARLALSLTLAISNHALVQKCGSEAMWSRAASSGMVAMPNGPDAPQRWPFHQSTCTLSASPVGLSLASGAPVRWLVSV